MLSYKFLDISKKALAKDYYMRIRQDKGDNQVSRYCDVDWVGFFYAYFE